MSAWLSPLAAMYGGAVAARGTLYSRGWLRTCRSPIPVISVGNLTAGGSGKSPMAGWIAARLRKRGFAPAIVSRGYGGAYRRAAALVSAGDGPLVGAATAGDEPVMLARQIAGVPIVVSRRRTAGVALAIERCGARCIVLDDGFQHLAIHRDLDLILFDARNPAGNGRLLPSGPLREPLSALRRAHAAILTRADRATPDRETLARSIIARHAGDIPVFTSRAAPRDLLAQDDTPLPLEALRGTRVVAFAGIARPGIFFEDLKALGATIVSGLRFSDHHRYSAHDRARIAEAAISGSASLIVTTEKDVARLAGDTGAAGAPWGMTPRLAALRMRMVVDDDAALLDLIEGVLV